MKVVELASVLAGPAAGSFFAELGAHVIKVENKRTGGDVTRGWQTHGESTQGPSAYFCSANFRKEYLPLDLNEENDRQTLKDHLSSADIVLTNHRDSTAEKFGLTYRELTRLRPDLIHIQLDGYVRGDRPAYDVVLQAETGWISMTGTDRDHLAKLPVALIDVLAGHQIKEATLLALIKRMKTGRGSFVRVTLEEASLAGLTNQATNYLMAGHTAKPMGTRHPNIAPYGDAFHTADGKIAVLAVGSDRQFADLARTLGKDELASDDRFADNHARLQHRDRLVAELQDAIGEMTSEELTRAWDAAKVPHGFVRDMEETLNSEAAQDMIREDIIDGHTALRLSSLAFSTDFLSRRASHGEPD